MMKKAIATMMCVVFLSVAASAFAETVYRTKNGKRYHKEDCRLIQNKNPQEIDLKEAMEKGLTPCGKCFKPEASSVEGAKTKKLSSAKKNTDKVN